jgi:HK97 family phage portal protein
MGVHGYNRRRDTSDAGCDWSNKAMIFDRLFEKRASFESVSDPASWLATAFGAVPNSAGVSVSEKTATQIVAFWSAINTISDTLAELPLKLVRTQADGSSDVVQIHQALRVLRNPNHMMMPVTFRSTCQAHTLTWGNSYAYIIRNGLGNPAELWPLNPATTRSVIKKSQLYFHAELEVGPTLIPAEDIIHIPALTRNGVDGMSIVKEQREMLGAAIAQQNFAGRFFSNGAKPSGLISYPGKVRDPDKIKTALQQSTGGENAHSMMVLDGDAKFTPFSIPPEDAQFLQTREFSVDEVGRMFRLPLHFLNKMGQATFNNLEMMGTHFVQYTMMPWIIRHEQEYTRKLLKQGEIDRGLKFKFNVSALIRGDIKTRSEVYAKAIQFGWMTRNEVRALEDQKPLEGLDDPLIPLNLGVVGEDKPETPPPPDSTASEDPNASEDDQQDEPTDEQKSRNYMVLIAAATRLANKEANKVRRLSAVKDVDGLIEFYRTHADHMTKNLAISAERARQYCQDRLVELQTRDPEEMLLDVTTNYVAKLVDEIIEESK